MATIDKCRVRVTVEGGAAFRVRLGWLLREDDGLREDAVAIRHAIARGETYEDGGGASPRFTIEPARRLAVTAQMATLRGEPVLIGTAGCYYPWDRSFSAFPMPRSAEGIVLLCCVAYERRRGAFNSARMFLLLARNV